MTGAAPVVTTGMAVSGHAQQRPQHPAILSPHGDRTYAELDGNANRLARVLREQGLEPGDSIGLVCRNRPEFAEVHAAAQRTGLRLVPINWHLTADEVSYILGDSDARAIVADAAFADAAGPAAARADVGVRLAVGGAIDGFSSYADALSGADDAPLPDPVPGRSMLYTSGTTGRPKGVDRPVTRPLSENPFYQRIFGAAAMRDDDVHLCTGPLYHAAPLAFSLTVPLLFGSTVVLMDGWDAAATVELIERHRVTHMHVVPTMFHRLLALPDDVRMRHDLSSLRFVLHGAAPCPVEVKRRSIEWLGPVVYEYYSATEGGGTFVDSHEWLARPGTVGRPVEEGMIRILDDAGEDVPVGEIGTVYIRSTQPFRYHNDDAKTSASYRGEFFTVGDHGYLDDEGYLFLTGRIAELIISGGVNIYPAEVDAVLLEHPAVADVGTIGVPDQEWGERVLAVVEPKPGVDASPALADELVTWCRDRLAHFKCPRSVEFVDELPRHDNGKLYRRRLREMFVASNLQ